MIDTIFLDLDGVIVDLHARLAELFKITTWPPGVWDLTKITGLTREQLWGDPRVQGAAFWESLPETPFARHVLEICEENASHVCFLSGLVLDHGAAAGKHAWLRKWRGHDDFDFLLGPSITKRLCARPGAVLVDDYDHNVTEFTERGGVGVLFPRPWNARHAESDRALLTLETNLRLASGR